MALRIGGLPLLTPSDLASGFRSLLGWTDEAVAVVADLPQRVADLVDEAERLVARVGTTLDRVDAAVARVDTTVDEVRAVAGRADGVARGAAGVVGRAGTVAGHADELVERIVPVTGAAEAVLESVGATGRGARELLDLLGPTTKRAAPLAARFLDEFTERELEGLIRLVDQVPVFTDRMESDVMPVLAKLDQVGPDVHELLDVLKDVRLAIQGVPGFALFRRRGAEKEDELADDRPETPPPIVR